jgi:hypothetical protein
MKKISLLTLSTALIAFSAPAFAEDDFGARFGGTSSTALQDAPATDDAPSDDILNIAPAAGDEAPTDPEAGADADAEMEATIDAEPIPAPAVETHAGTETTLDGPSEPEPTQAEKTESAIIQHDQGMSPDDSEDPSYRLQDSAD